MQHFGSRPAIWSILRLLTSALIASSCSGALGVEAPKSRSISAPSAPFMSAPGLTYQPYCGVTATVGPLPAGDLCVRRASLRGGLPGQVVWLGLARARMLYGTSRSQKPAYSC